MNRYQEAQHQMVTKLSQTAPKAAEAGIIPYKSESGKWIPSPFAGNGWWTGGFWPGLMWQLFQASDNQFFRQEACRTEALLTDEFRHFRELNHDVGFMYLLSCGANAKLTRNEQSEWDTLHAASLMMGRFNPRGFFRAWDGTDRTGYAIIDCMMNLSLLFRASRMTGDPRFSHAARIHADTTLREFLRPDGSVSHIIEFDPETGKRVREHAGQGYALGSQWSRGQAWGLYGFTLAWMNTKDQRYLNTAIRIADHFIMHIRPDGLTDSDFCQPEDEERIDNLAGAIAACGMWELSRETEDSRFRDASLRLTDGLLDHCCDWSTNRLGVLTHCTASYHDDGAGRHTNIVYGDYFLSEILGKINGTDPMLWI